LRGDFMIGLIYRFGFVLSLLSNVIYMGIAYYLWRSIYGSAETLRGLTFSETFIYVALGSSVFILLKTYADWGIAYDIRDGRIAISLVRPMDYQLFVLASSIGQTLISVVAITLPTVLLLVLVFQTPLPLGPGLALFPISLAMAFLISFCFDYFIGLLAFYTESIWGLSVTKEVLVTVLSGALLPLQFFPAAIQQVLMVLPFQAIYYTPLMLVIKPNQSLEVMVSMLLVQLVWVVIMVGLTRLFFNQAVKVLRVSGG
jgi:ABC-2 type transport system permease protein